MVRKNYCYFRFSCSIAFLRQQKKNLLEIKFCLNILTNFSGNFRINNDYSKSPCYLTALLDYNANQFDNKQPAKKNQMKIACGRS